MARVSTYFQELAERYATALFDLADQDKALDAVAQDLTNLKAVLGESPDLQMLTRNPVFSRDDQHRAMEAILEKVGCHKLIRNLVGVMIGNRRLFVLEVVIDGFLAEMARRRGQVTAVVTSARPLKDAHVSEITNELKKVYGKGLVIDQEVDPSLIGGLVVRVGSRMVDNSMRTKLNRLEHAMKGAG